MMSFTSIIIIAFFLLNCFTYYVSVFFNIIFIVIAMQWLLLHSKAFFLNVMTWTHMVIERCNNRGKCFSQVVNTLKTFKSCKRSITICWNVFACVCWANIFLFNCTHKANPDIGCCYNRHKLELLTCTKFISTVILYHCLRICIFLFLILPMVFNEKLWLVTPFYEPC